MRSVRVTWFVWIPVIVSVVFAVLFAGVLSNSGDFTLYKELKASGVVAPSPWAKLLMYAFIVLGVASLLSVGLWVYLHYSKPEKVGRSFHDKAFCDNFIRDDLFKRCKYNVIGFTEIGTSVDSAQNFSCVADDPEYVYFSSYRVSEQGGRDRFVLALMNMEEGKEFLVHYEHDVYNDKKSRLMVVDREAPRLIQNREKVRVVIQDDFTTGRRQQSQIPIQDREGDEKPVKNGVVKHG